MNNHSLFFFVLIFCVAAGYAIPKLSAAQSPNPLTCEGYPESRFFLESQVWWKDDTVARPEGRHIHLGTCFPLHQTVSGVLHFDLRILLHNMANAGAITKLRVQIFENGTSDQYTTESSVNLACTTDDCQWWQPIDIDTMRVAYDGWWEFRFTADIAKTFQGNRMFETTRWRVNLKNEKPPMDTLENIKRSPGAAGWYTGVEYMNVFCGLDGTGYDFVTKVHSGPVSLKCQFDRDTAFVSIDPSFHSTPPNPGKVLRDSLGGTYTINFDTNNLPDGTSLTSGPHKLFLRTDATGIAPPGTGSGIVVLPFTVGSPGPHIKVTPGSYDYGNVVVGSSQSNNFTVSNTGSDVLNVSDISLLGDTEFDFTDGPPGAFTLSPNASRDVSVTFLPTSEGSNKNATLKFSSNDSASPLDISLTGTGVTTSNSPPVASAVAITDAGTGNPPVGQALTGSYSYSDAEEDAEGTSTFRWLRNGTAIAGATAQTYTLVAADAGTSVSFEVTPVAMSGASPGTAVASDPPVDVNSYPVAKSVAINGTPQVGQTLAGTYIYDDADTDAEGASTFRWLRNGAAIADATTPSYTLVVADAGTMVSFEVTPVAVSGSSPGTAAVSPAMGIGGVQYQETVTGGSSGSTVATSAALTGGTGDLYLAAVSTRPNVAVSTITSPGLTWTPVAKQCSGRNSTGVTLWKAQGSGSGIVTATLGASATNAVISVSHYSGVSTTNPVGNMIAGNTLGSGDLICSGGTDSSAYSFNLTTSVPGAVVYAAVGERNRTHTPGTGYTERLDIHKGSGNNAAGLAAEDRTVASASSVAVNGKFSGTVDWAVIGLEIEPP